MRTARKTRNMKFVIINLRFCRRNRPSFNLFIYFFFCNSTAQFVYKQNANKKKIKITARKTRNMKFVIINLQFRIRNRPSFYLFIYFFFHNSTAQFLYKQNANKQKIKNWYRSTSCPKIISVNEFLTRRGTWSISQC